MKLALYGGTFDPFHEGHRVLATALADALGLDRVILMPTAQPPHKLKAEMAAGLHRAEMCRLATEGDARFCVSDLELLRGGASFTADTLDVLCEQYPEDEWYLLTGADMFLTLGTWFRFADIAARATLCAVPRGGVTKAQLEAYAHTLEKSGARCIVTDVEAPTVSSTDIRARVREGKPLCGLVAPAVEAYIKCHGLYTDTADAAAPTKEQLCDILRRRLSESRYAHSLCVADEARRLAERYGADADRAYLAGLVHDVLKNTPPEEQRRIAEALGVTLDAVEQSAPSLWHARIGAAFLEQVLGIADKEVISAVRYHTTGRADMTLLEEIVFVADLTAVGRDYADVETVRRLADSSLDAAAEYILRWLIQDLNRKGRKVHPDTERALAFLTRKGALTDG